MAVLNPDEAAQVLGYENFADFRETNEPMDSSTQLAAVVELIATMMSGE
ncbi:MAG TPA: hypothetical protein VG797_10645 [Phycisphaerales bacterium]|nr:hypothetical protein [Phycisphaerales bacterium]